MSSSPPFLASSSSSPLSAPPKSRFTYTHLALLAASSPTTPLRVIAHIDLDAFYAQCEMIRLGLPCAQPLAVQQWQGLIAINYAARAFGLSRHVDIATAKRLCPAIICQHVATWREGHDTWAYRDDAAQHIATDKVSLDPYRAQSRAIFGVVKEVLPAPPIQRVEKASMDEAFLDLSAQVHALLLDRYPQLAGPPPHDDPSQQLPRPPTTVLDWGGATLVDLDAGEAEEQDPDWDDVGMQLASEIVQGVRGAVRERLAFTCSAGIARNKMMAKLGSAQNKPNGQTVVRNRAVQHFLGGFKFTKIRNLGGKLGDRVVEVFGTAELKELLAIPVETMKARLGDDTGTWLHAVIRGEEHSEVSSRTQIKSMLSAKSFRPSINTIEQAHKWLRIFVADIYARLVEEGVVENKRRPKTMNLHHRQGGQTRSRQIPVPSGRKIDEASLLELAKTLLGQVIVDGRAWPCANLSLSVGGFEDGVTGNRGIGSFLIRGEEAKARSNAPARPDSPLAPLDDEGRPEKRRKTGLSLPGITHYFFAKQESAEEYDEEFGAESESDQPVQLGVSELQHAEHTPLHHRHERDIVTFFCKRCQGAVPEMDRDEHEDWHFAQELQELCSPVKTPLEAGKSASSSKANRRASIHARPGRGARAGRGQTRLAFS
jgi:DNA polymerase eta